MERKGRKVEAEVGTRKICRLAAGPSFLPSVSPNVKGSMRFHGPRVHLAPPTAALPRLPLLLAYDCVLSEGRCKKGSHSNRPTLHYCTASGQRSYCSLPLSDLSGLHSFCLLFLCALQSQRVRTRLLQKSTKGPGGKYPRLSSLVSIDWPDPARVFHVLPQP